ncbi:hypothetical protein V6N11_008651 [Hibiscus sabdariffa]|uniref:Uncharacterized protein n=2 Tax=Hibiscus sabdariffa TaxID=183260 RepID=A0ABR2PPE1_9ROSI
MKVQGSRFGEGRVGGGLCGAKLGEGSIMGDDEGDGFWSPLLGYLVPPTILTPIEPMPTPPIVEMSQAPMSTSTTSITTPFVQVVTQSRISIPKWKIMTNRASGVTTNSRDTITEHGLRGR